MDEALAMPAWDWSLDSQVKNLAGVATTYNPLTLEADR